MSKQTPYWLEYLRHPTHIMAVMAGGAAALLASLPWGGDGFALVMLAMAALETVALAVIPSLPPFREWANKRERNEIRNAMRIRFVEEIQSHGGTSHLQSYMHMSERIRSLYRLTDDPQSTLKRSDVESLEDATLDYLRLCLSDAAMKDNKRKGTDSVTIITGKLAEVRAALKKDDLMPPEQQQLKLAENQFTEALARQSRMASRKAVLEASLLSMPVRMEEVYQMVMTTPRADNLGSLLEESLSKLRITEEVTLELDQELGLTNPAFLRSVPVAPVQPVPQRAVQNLRH